MNLGLRTLLTILLPLAVILGGAGYLVVAFMQDAQATRTLVLQTHDRIETAKSLLSAVQDAETGQRGYVLTGEELYRQPYDSGVESAQRLADRLAQEVAGDPDQTQRMAAARTALRAKLDELARTIEVRRTQGFEAARAIVLTDSGKISMDAIRRTLGEMVAAESALLAARLQEAASYERRATAAAAAVGLLGGLALVLGAIMLVRNLLQLRKAEAAAGAEAGLLRATLDNTREGILAFDAGGGLSAWNERALALFGLPPELGRRGALSGAFGGALNTPAGLALFEPPAANAAANGGTSALTVGGRDLECFRSRMAAGGFIVSCADVTQRNRSEAMARQAQRMEAIGHLTGGIAHDFNNLLQVIRANLDLLRPTVGEDAQAMRRLNDAQFGAERGARLTRQLLAFARRQPLAPVAVDLGRLVGDMANLLRRTLGETIEVETVVAGGLWNTLVDPGQIESALLNLAVNARDAMPEGGKLTIELGNATLDDAYAAANHDVTPGQYVMMAVTDTGHGMPPEVAARAFEPFFSTKPEGRGTGLGLSMVYGFVKQSGGHAKIYSEPGQGTTVRIYLPRTRQAAEAIETPAVAAAVGGSESVLVVEDDAAVRKAAVELLESLGYRVSQAGDAEAALAILTGDAAVDLLFTDVVMPGSIGSRELARRAQALRPGLAVLFTSGYTENAIIHHGRLDPDVALLSKPYGRDELARKVRALLRARPQPAAAVPAADARPPSLHLLVVEDDMFVRLGTVGMLEALGHRIAEAANGAAALAALDGAPGLDAALVDLGLPDMRGEDLIAELRRRKPALGIIVATGQGPEALDGSPRPAVLFIGKPFSEPELREALARLGAPQPA
ncbi:MAG TPA: CHASE3 domain-containing protein [Candidatus Acidoferrum sp.]|nr:CHASE3 domain-containing protein [Candidatus Acidoferrum sp.]